MRFLIALVFFSAFLATAVEGKHWAVLVAGSNGWMNYRHQADVCHSYHVVRSHGIPDENIIVMMYDDIARNSMNKFKGKIFNKPNGSDVYQGVPKDYTGKDVNPETFLNVLQGNEEALKSKGSGKVVNSGPDDNIFVFFSDHGAPGLIAFPHKELHKKDLNDAIKNMHNNKRYNKMVFYIEACESGSMFKNMLPDNINVYATTASNSRESSYAFYFDDTLEVFLGDLYSIRWMEDSDQEDLTSETLQDQFKLVKKTTNKSHVQEYGDISMGSMTLAQFQGNGQTKFGRKVKKTPFVSSDNAIPAPDVPLQTLYNRLRNAETDEKVEEIIELIRHEKHMRNVIKKTVKKIAGSMVMSEEKRKQILKAPAHPTNHECYKEAVTKFRTLCFDFNKYEYALRHVYVLSNLCDEGFQTQSIIVAMENSCSSLHHQVFVF